MDAPFVVRHPTPADAAAIAEVHVKCWQETYRGLMRDEVLDDPEMLSRREHMWTLLLTDSQYASVAVAIAELNSEIIGFASAGPPFDENREDGLQLHTLYVVRSSHGSGAGAALLAAVIGTEAAQLWVADPNPRAQIFYRKQGFSFDGTARHEDGIRELRMVRAVQKI